MTDLRPISEEIIDLVMGDEKIMEIGREIMVMLDDTRIEGRMHDGWEYVVDLRDGRSIHLADPKAIEGMWAAVVEAANKREPIVFSGAHSADENGHNVSKKLDGVGILPASEILCLRYAGVMADAPRVAAYEAACALLEAQSDATDEFTRLAQAAGGEDEEDADGDA